MSSWLASLLIPTGFPFKRPRSLSPPVFASVFAFSEMARNSTQLKKLTFTQASGKGSFPKDRSFLDLLSVQHFKHAFLHLTIEPFIFCSHHRPVPVKEIDPYIDWLTNEVGLST
ncbi:hypothetical protein E1B28_003086 [Marasmius oreades]|uniref:Uncharacterized protein n=1 Tax=Marasmius oreades TaxID=181124 RepID=A0A9P7RL43_9AGAR|nr:uncharacterized protein E1B28_003086 [Marasmius oreades]KAG7085527.1 hypothetical protein E1B28_003086 [Marasmius oreades]